MVSRDEPLEDDCCTRKCPAMQQPLSRKEGPDGSGIDYWFCKLRGECVRPLECETPEIYVSTCNVRQFFIPRIQMEKHDKKVAARAIKVDRQKREITIGDVYFYESGMEEGIRKERDRTCHWKQDDDDIYHTECGEMFEMLNADSTAENKFNYCTFCGGLLKQVQET